MVVPVDQRRGASARRNVLEAPLERATTRPPRRRILRFAPKALRLEPRVRCLCRSPSSRLARRDAGQVGGRIATDTLCCGVPPVVYT